MDDQEDIAEEVPKVSDRGPVDPAAEDKPSSGTEATPPEPASEEVPAELTGPAPEGLQPTPRLYRLRPPGLRPIRRPLRRHGLRNDCPPDLRRRPKPLSSRTRLR